MFQRETIARVTEALEEKRRRREAEADLRRGEAEEKNPRLKKLGEQLRTTTVRVLSEAMKGGADLPARISAIQEENRLLREKYAAELEKMGLPRDYTQPRRDCPLCQDSGYQGRNFCSCMRRALILEHYRNSGIGKLLKKQNFDNFNLAFYPDTPLPGKNYSPREVMASHLRYCRDWAENFSTESPSLLFIGGTGLGKTHLSTAIAGKVIDRGFEVVYESAPNVAAIFEKERFLPEEEAKGTRRLFEAPLLILDDLGTETVSKANASAIYHLINHRASVASLPTVINTNLTAKQLEKQYDTATYSRLLGEFETKVFLGSDIRLAKLK